MKWKAKAEPRHKAGPETKTKLEARVEKIPTPDLLQWAEQALFGIGRSLSDWQRGNSREALVEAEQGSEALHAVMRELRKRFPL